MRAEFYVYVLFRPDGTPCYVGKGKGDRWLQHGRKGRCSNPRLRKIIADAGGDIPRVRIRENLTNDDARRIEMIFIAAIGRGADGPLVNMTDGGEGVAGMPMPAEIRAKIAKANSGKPKSEDHRRNLSEARKAMFAARKAAGIKTVLSPAHRAAISAGNVGKVMGPESRQRMSLAKKGKPCHPNTRQSLSACARNKTPEHRAKLAEMCRERNVLRSMKKCYGVAIGLGNAEGF